MCLVQDVGVSSTRAVAEATSLRFGVRLSRLAASLRPPVTNPYACIHTHAVTNPYACIHTHAVKNPYACIHTRTLTHASAPTHMPAPVALAKYLQVCVHMRSNKTNTA